MNDQWIGWLRARALIATIVGNMRLHWPRNILRPAGPRALVPLIEVAAGILS